MAEHSETAEGPDQPMTGTEYFKRCLGSEAHQSLTGLGKHNGAHPVTIRRVYEEAKALHPAAADVIAAMVFWNAIDRNRDDFLRSVKNAE